MQRKMSLAVCLLLSVVSVMIVGCAGGNTAVTRMDSDTDKDLSGRWNDGDSRRVSEEIITDALSRPWIEKYEKAGKTPTVKVGRIVNKSHEHINVETFTKDIEKALLNSGKVEFIATNSEVGQLRDEMDSQETNASATTRSDRGEEQGADLMLVGSINTIEDREGKRSVMFYQINMELIELESTKKVFIGDKKIKKYIEKASAKF